MAEYVARCDLFRPFAVEPFGVQGMAQKCLDFLAGEVDEERGVEIEDALVHQPHDGVGEQGLGQRRRLEDGLLVYGPTGVSVLHPESLMP